MPQPGSAEEAEVEQFYEDLQDILELTSKKNVLYIKRDWNEKVGNQTLKKEVPRVTGKFGLGVQNETEQRLTDFCQENTLVIKKTLFEQHKRTLLLLLSHFSRVRLCATPQSPPGSAVPGILQARTLGWVAISFSNA